MIRLPRTTVVVAAIGAVALLSVPTREWMFVRIVYNASNSAPQGWYVISPKQNVRREDYVLARLPESAEALADARGYLPAGVPVLKRVAASAGQSVCMRAGVAIVDGMVVGEALAGDGRGRQLRAWKDCRQLGDEFFLIGDGSPASFDSRYFGPVPRASIMGRATPLWTW